MTEKTKKRKLALTGFMATGKSRVGRLIAHRLSLPLIDTDKEILARWGKTPARFILEDGEQYFRHLESVLIDELAQSAQAAVIATGGGTLIAEENFLKLERSAVIVLLDARPEVIAERVSRSAELRPKLLETNKPLLDRIVELKELRRHAYERAHFKVDTSELSPEEVAELVIAGAIARGFTL